jgi:hypothetical protein
VIGTERGGRKTDELADAVFGWHRLPRERSKSNGLTGRVVRAQRAVDVRERL